MYANFDDMSVKVLMKNYFAYFTQVEGCHFKNSETCVYIFY